MSTPLSVGTTSYSANLATIFGDLAQMESDREQLTRHLRALAADLDGLDRRLSDLIWRQRCRPADPAEGEMLSERTTLESRRAEMASRLRDLARKLNDLDAALAGRKGLVTAPATRVGICPDCGYPSLDSGLCAFCRPRRAF